MTTIGFKRMRLNSHAQIKRLIDFHEQRMRQLSKTVDKKYTCRYYAKSAFLLCAVNPLGSCERCRDYEPDVTFD
ncbi:DUF6464 family protein [Coleofasciculus sp. G2-EDA-02]|uniref:DUF6464 family protein n=1 Tax=Coleofasciculus sp. G2-EDA-02 TaxID=3069529 RepID=UPI0032FC6D8A